MVNFVLIIGGLALGILIDKITTPSDFTPTDQKVDISLKDLFTDDD